MAFQYHNFCFYNEGVTCGATDTLECDTCGWNPVVAEERMKRLGLTRGEKKTEGNCRPVNAILQELATIKANLNGLPERVKSLELEVVRLRSNLQLATAERNEWQMRALMAETKTKEAENG